MLRGGAGGGTLLDSLKSKEKETPAWPGLEALTTEAVITLTTAPTHDGTMHANCHPGEGDKGCFLRAWSKFCASVRYFLYGVSVPFPQRSLRCSQGGALKEVSLMLRLRWEFSLYVPSMREVGAQSEKVVSVCRIFLSDSCCIRPSFHQW